jgi:hypothetical protein
MPVSAVGLDDPACREAEGGHVPEVFSASEWSFDVENVRFFQGENRLSAKFGRTAAVPD